MVRNANAATDAVDLTAADIQGPGTVAPAAVVVLDLTGTLGAGAAATLPTVAALVAAFNLSLSGSFSYLLRVLHSGTGAFDWTVTTNTGWTLTGTMTVAQGTTRDLLVTVDTDTMTATAVSVGTGTV
jgi:hypothetical protein